MRLDNQSMQVCGLHAPYLWQTQNGLNFWVCRLNDGDESQEETINSEKISGKSQALSTVSTSSSIFLASPNNMRLFSL